MAIPERLKRMAGQHALVDGIAFETPVDTKKKSPAILASFPINADKAQKLLPGKELHVIRTWSRGSLIITVINYLDSSIGSYIEYSIAIACTHGRRAAPRLLPLLFMKRWDSGQYVYDLPVSTEISVKGGKGIWGMPKHQASIDFLENEHTISSQYDLDGQLMMKLEIDRPKSPFLKLPFTGINYCAFRGLLMKSSIYGDIKMAFSLFRTGSARLYIGDHPKMGALRELEIDPRPTFTAYLPENHGVLDDHFESWFLTQDEPPAIQPEGLESVFHLNQGREWLPPPKAPATDEHLIR